MTPTEAKIPKKFTEVLKRNNSDVSAGFLKILLLMESHTFKQGFEIFFLKSITIFPILNKNPTLTPGLFDSSIFKNF